MHCKITSIALFAASCALGLPGCAGVSPPASVDTAPASLGSLQGYAASAKRQTDLGITPYSILGGLLSVQDEVVVEFHLIGE